MASESQSVKSNELAFTDKAQLQQFKDLVQSLNDAAPVGEEVAVDQEGVKKTDGRPLIAEVFVILVGTAWLIRQIQEIYTSITKPGGTRIDASQGSRPTIERDPELPDNSVVIIAKDGTVEYKAEESSFSVVMQILKAVLVALVSGSAKGAKAVSDAAKDGVSKAGGDESAVTVTEKPA